MRVALVLALLVSAGCRTTDSSVADAETGGSGIRIQRCGFKDNPQSIRLVYTRNLVAIVIAEPEGEQFGILGRDGSAKFQVLDDETLVSGEYPLVKASMTRIRELREFVVSHASLNPTATRWIEASVKGVPVGDRVQSYPAAGTLTFGVDPDKGTSTATIYFGTKMSNISPERPYLLSLAGDDLLDLPIPVEFVFNWYLEGKWVRMSVDPQWWGDGVYPREFRYDHDGKRRGMLCDAPVDGTAADLPQASPLAKAQEVSAEHTSTYAAMADMTLSLSMIGGPQTRSEQDFEAATFLFCSKFVQITANTRPESADVIKEPLTRFLSSNPHFLQWRRLMELQLKRDFGGRASEVYERVLWNGCVAGQLPELRLK